MAMSITTHSLNNYSFDARLLILVRKRLRSSGVMSFKSSDISPLNSRIYMSRAFILCSLSSVEAPFLCKTLLHFVYSFNVHTLAPLTNSIYCDVSICNTDSLCRCILDRNCLTASARKPYICCHRHIVKCFNCCWCRDCQCR